MEQLENKQNRREGQLKLNGRVKDGTGTNPIGKNYVYIRALQLAERSEHIEETEQIP